MAVHHIDVEHAATGGFERCDLFAQAGKIRREDGWEDLDHRFYKLHRAQRSGPRLLSIPSERVPRCALNYTNVITAAKNPSPGSRPGRRRWVSARRRRDCTTF